MEFKKYNFLLLLTIGVCLLHTVQPIKIVNSFEELGRHHCTLFPIETLWRIASGNISDKYGEQYFDFDCYIRQFVREGINIC